MKSAALIVTFNRLEKLRKCWAASAALDFIEIIIVNNASTDETSQWLSTLNDPRLRVITLAENTGGAGGFMAGIEYFAQRHSHLESAKQPIDWVVIYDDDAYPPVDLIAQFESIQNVKYQAYCCQVHDLAGNVCKMNVPYKIFPATLTDNLRYLSAPEKFLPDANISQTVETFSFVGLIIDKNVLVDNRTSLFPELFIYYDDLYFSKALTDKGIRIRYSKEIVFKHDIPVNVRNISPTWKVYYLVRNLFLARHLSPGLKSYSSASIVLRVLKYITLVVKQSEKSTYLRFIFKGITDGLFNKSGKKH